MQRSVIIEIADVDVSDSTGKRGTHGFSSLAWSGTENMKNGISPGVFTVEVGPGLNESVDDCDPSDFGCEQ